MGATGLAAGARGAAHDLADAEALGGRVAVIEAGRLVQVGP
ncbi:hypothetical protein [Haliangium sp.]